MRETMIARAFATEPPPRRFGVLATLLAIAATTGLIYPLAQIMPVQSTVVLYLPIVLTISMLWGFGLGLLSGVLSSLAFNFCHIPPVGQFTIARSEDWVALATYFVVAAIASAVAEAARSAERHRERLREELVEAEAVRRSDAMKTALLRSVSHDLRSPVTAIAVAADSLASRSLPEADRVQLASDIEYSARKLSDLIDKLLDVSRLQAGVAVPRTDWCSLEELAVAAADATQPFDVPGVRCASDVPLVRADAAQLERAIANLLENAARHGGGAERIEIRKVGPTVELDVVDRGPGIDERERKTLFEPFATGAGESGGTGLGLAIVRGFVEVNDGTVTYLPTPGGGATFRITLPAEERPPATSMPAAKAGASNQ